MSERLKRIIAIFFALNILFEVISPSVALALTSGPSQPEVQAFTPVSTSDMVNVFSGDFNYNIPLLDVEGYPVNLAYNAGVTMDQEASWVGLGWNINPGTLNRGMRGLPDDFNGEEVVKQTSMKANQTFGLSLSPGVEIFGKDIKKQSAALKLAFGLNYNSYNGCGVDMSANISLSSSMNTKSSVTGGLGLSSGTGKGLGITANAGFEKKTMDYKDGNAISTKKSTSLGLGFNTVSGLTGLTYNTSVTRSFLNIASLLSFSIKLSKSSANGGSSFSFANPTYIPNSGPSMINMGLSLTGSFGAEAVGTHPKGSLTAYYSGAFIRDKELKYGAYGYLYSDGANDGTRQNLLHDFNREKDAGFNMNTPNLPVTNYSYDSYSYSGQGIGGSFRPFRNDVGTVFDPYVKNFPDINANVGFEIGGGNLAHGGLNVALMFSRTKGGKWVNLNEAAKEATFKGKQEGFSENVFFKQTGEKTAETDMAYFNNTVNGFNPVYFDLQVVGPEAACTKNMKNEYGGSKTLANTLKSSRARRNENVTVLTADMASVNGVETTIKSYSLDATFSVFDPSPCGTCTTPIPRVGGDRKANHISEISTVRDDGARYVYGLPAYNTEQKEVTFSTEASPNFGTGQVTYLSGEDDVNTNSSGNDHYYQSSKLPAYAHSFLLTSVLSADYVDKTGNGPSNDDLGKYTKFNYTRVNSDYGWRTPYGASKATFNAGLRSSTGAVGDDKASYVIGKKEIWMLHSIETKNYVAVFELQDRDDAFPIDPTNLGGVPSYTVTNKSQCLKEIRLYTKQEIKRAGSVALAIPLKKVTFTYDYSLCTKIENNKYIATTAPGKLTLKKVHFTYQGSSKGMLSPYVFDYGDNDHDNGAFTAAITPTYNIKAYDRWGTYQSNVSTGSYNPDATGNSPLADEFPYTNQDLTSNNPNDNAAAWNLTSIKLPSGGEIKVTYEADDYAYVQDKKAMKMFITAGADANPNVNPTGNSSTLYSGSNNYDYMYLKTTASDLAAIADYTVRHSGSTTKDAVRDLFFKDETGKDIKYVYFRFLVNVERNLSAFTPKWEYVSGYAKIDYNTTLTVTAAPDLDGSNIRFKVVEEEIFDNISLPGVKVHPISMAGINFVRKYMPRVAFDNYQDPFGGPLNLLNLVMAIKSSVTPIVQFFKGGMSNALRLSRASSQFQTKRSFVRLYAGDGCKKGGGYRVKRIELDDNWKAISNNNNNNNNTYGQEYFYQTKNSDGRVISSGVASYEPLIGGDENPFRQPVFYKEQHILAPDDDFYQEEPFGESFFPGPSVGYSRVTVRNLVKDSGPSIVRRHATGAVVHEFYTAKDFPTKATRTNMRKERHKPNPVVKFLKFFVKDYMTTSQGYQIVLNDMHGKPKAQWVYKEPDAAITNANKILDEYYGNNYISGIEYKYKRNLDQLNNNADVIQKSGQIENTQVGVDYDMVVDSKDSQTWTANASTNGNLEGFLLAIFPALVPTIFPGYNQEKVKYRSSVITKVLYRYGLLEETIAYDNGASVSTKNKLWDAETGEVVLTETVNNFNDAVYNLKYPAHWAYDRMGQAAKNILATSTISGGNLNNPQVFVTGDEVLLSGATNVKAWVLKTSPAVVIIDNNGNTINLGSYTAATVTRSGNRNQQNVNVANVTSLINPVNSNVLVLNNSSKVLNASAAEFKDEWPIFCNCGTTSTSVKNPFLTGQKGNWRAYAGYVYLTGREQTKQNQNTNLRKDGPYKTYAPFWSPNPSANPYNWTKSTEAAWQYTSKSTMYSPYGFELENQDALGRNSAALYGYGNTLPVAVSSNAKYRQVAFDGFEDYDYNNPCENDRFTYIQFDEGSGIVTYPTPNYISKTASPNQKYAHTGRKAMVVVPGQTITVTTTVQSTGCSPLIIN